MDRLSETFIFTTCLLICKENLFANLKISFLKMRKSNRLLIKQLELEEGLGNCKQFWHNCPAHELLLN